MMQVGVPLPAFDRPEVEGADANDVLDPDNVPPTGATLVVPYLGTQDKDRVNYRWRGSASGGSISDHVDLIPATAGRPVRITVDKKYVTANLNGTVVADYSIQRGNVPLGQSRELTLRIGTALTELPPPFLVAPAIDPIDVLAYPNGVTVRIEFLEALSGDKANLEEVNPPPGWPPFPLVEFNSNKRVNTVLSPAFLAARHGKVIELRWSLNRNGSQAGQSGAIKVSVLKMVDEDPRFPTPNIDSNTSNELDVQELTANARILAAKWPLFEPGQPIWVTVAGFNKNGDPVSEEVRSGEPNDSVDGLSVAAPIEWLKELKEGTELKIACAVNLDGSAIKANAVTFPLRSYGIKNFSPPLYENFDDTPNQLITVGQRIELPSMTITFISGGGQMGVLRHESPPVPGKISGQVLQLGYRYPNPQRCRIDLKSTYSKVSFWQHGTEYENTTASFYNTAGQPLGERTFTLSRSDAHLVEFSAIGITRIEILINVFDWIVLDHFSFFP